MPNLDYALLSPSLRPLLDKFYRAHGSSMRANGEGQLWVARDGGIIAGLSLTAVADGFWLTGLFVDPQRRGQGIAGQLVAHALATLTGRTWLFCHPDLRDFYGKLGFSPTRQLPQALADRLARYSRSKPLIALGIEPSVSSTAENV
ncbi:MULTISPECIES: GNAT family N-acetyltransferase [Pseudomonas]|uniref:Putative acetyltransferase n=1 Tax=Pseudomonas asplenii TaxID=53407 RepID=A0A0M9GJX6_9PSED|nr:GNAT family N-acetyltransferase [Pseudomonas fuscovaginae]KPA93119.1 putative acetyltransferase [Pseudomonas fuscovaginae]KPA98423.1 putative acetyltransferase [Pseudomonas fuscovaginae]